MAEISDNIFQVIEASKSFAARELFSKISFSINSGEHVGVIGPNGAGKSTLFKCILGEDSFDSGRVVRRAGLRIGYLPQQDDWQLEETLESYVMAKSHIPLWDLKQLGEGLGITQSFFARPMSTLNGGMRMRAKLLALLAAQPDLMMLDEPTNYLDLESLIVLENFLQSFSGAFLLISHDREFLRRTTDHILEIESGEVTKFNGALDDYFEQKESLRLQLESRAMGLAQKRKEVLDFVARFGAKASKAKQSQSRLKSLDRMEVINLKDLPVKARIKIPPPTHCGKDMMRALDIDLGYPDRKVLSKCHFDIRNGEKVAVVGFNGAGKSTLLKALAGELTPLRGKIEIGYQVSWSFYAQHVAEGLNSTHTVLQAMGEDAHSSVTSQDVLDMAGSLLFSGDDVRKKVSVLSGGEKSRVALGRMLLRRTPMLILDEPTNHLDFQTVEALADALKHYAGTIVFVSHDRSFVARVATKIVEIQNGQALVWHGTYNEYVWSVSKGVLSQRAVAKGASAKVNEAPTKAVVMTGMPIIGAPIVGGGSTGASTLGVSPLGATSAAARPVSFEQRKQNQRDLFQAQKKSEQLERTLLKVEKDLEVLQNKVSDGGGSHHQFNEIAQLVAQKAELENLCLVEMESIESLKKLMEK